jgi:hypothetical protein
MNEKVQEFDTVVLGFDEKSKATVEALQEQGENVLYISIDPQTMISLIAQKQVHTAESDKAISHLQIQKHHMETPIQHSTTYLLQPVVQIETTTSDQVIDQTAKETEEIELQIPSPNDNDSDVVLHDEVEPQKVAFSFEDVSNDLPHSNEDKEADVVQATGVEHGTKKMDEEQSAEKIAIDMKTEPVDDREQEQSSDESIEDTEEKIANEATVELEKEQEQQPDEDKEEKTSKKVSAEESEEFSFPIITPLTKESSLIDNRMLGIRGSKYRGLQRSNKPGAGSMLSSYHLFNPIRIEGEEDTEALPFTAEQDTTVPLENESNTGTSEQDEIEQNDSMEKLSFMDKNFIFHGPQLSPDNTTISPQLNSESDEVEDNEQQDEYLKSSDTQLEFVEDQDEWDDPDLMEHENHPNTNQKKKMLPDFDDLILQSHLEEDVSLEDDNSVVNETSNSDVDNENNIEKDSTTKDEQIESEEEHSNPPTLVLDRDIRLRKKFSFHQLHQETKPEQTPDSVNREKTVKNNEEEQTTKKPDIFPLEPFSSRRRNKKSRLFSTLESTIPNPIVQPSTTPKQEKSFSNLIQDSIIHHELEEKPAKTINPESMEMEDFLDQNEEDNENVEMNSDNNLKIDNIEFEEPYGYNSFEDFFPSFSNSNDRKRQEMDKIEKRKIALRGLHNLINNLG